MELLREPDLTGSRGRRSLEAPRFHDAPHRSAHRALSGVLRAVAALGCLRVSRCFSAEGAARTFKLRARGRDVAAACVTLLDDPLNPS
jgi:hypothetical protein